MCILLYRTVAPNGCGIYRFLSSALFSRVPLVVSGGPFLTWFLMWCGRQERIQNAQLAFSNFLLNDKRRSRIVRKDISGPSLYFPLPCLLPSVESFFSFSFLFFLGGA